MNELSLFVLELAENSAEAGALLVKAEVRSAPESVEITVTDDGEGMTAEQSRDAVNTGYTTKSGRRGRGLPLIKAAAEKTGGGLSLSSRAGKGTKVRVRFIKNEYCPPMGDINSVIRILAICHSNMDFRFEIEQSGKRMTFDTRVIKERIAPAKISSGGVSSWIREYLNEQTEFIFGGAANEITC